MRGFRSVVALLLFACFSLQAVAIPAIALVCSEPVARDEIYVLMHAEPGIEHSDVHHGHGDTNRSHGDGHDHSTAGHSCCHSFGTASIGVPIGIPDPSPGTVVVTASLHLFEFFPDRPKRPPLASV